MEEHKIIERIERIKMEEHKRIERIKIEVHKRIERIEMEERKIKKYNIADISINKQLI